MPKSSNNIPETMKQDLMRLRRSMRERGNGIISYIRKSLSELLQSKQDTSRPAPSREDRRDT